MAEIYQTAMAQGVTEEELNQAKNKVLARTVLRSERPMGRLTSARASTGCTAAYISVEKELEAYNRVTLADLAGCSRSGRSGR